MLSNNELKLTICDVLPDDHEKALTITFFEVGKFVINDEKHMEPYQRQDGEILRFKLNENGKEAKLVVDWTNYKEKTSQTDVFTFSFGAFAIS